MCYNGRVLQENTDKNLLNRKGLKLTFPYLHYCAEGYVRVVVFYFKVKYERHFETLLWLRLLFIVHIVAIQLMTICQCKCDFQITNCLHVHCLNSF